MRSLIRRRIPLLLALAVAIGSMPTAGLADESEKVIRLGMIGLDTSHVIAFTKYLNDPKNKTGCRVVAGYPGGSPDFPASANRVDKFTTQLRDQFGLEIVDSVEELCEKVDGILLESVDGRPHLKQAKIAIAAGKPLFVDKPVADDLADVIEIFRLAQEKNVPCWSSSAMRFGEGVAGARSNEAVGQIVGCDVFGSSSWAEKHPSLYLYGIHAVEPLFTVMGTGCQTVRRIKTDRGDMAVGVWKDGRIGTFRDLRGGKTDFQTIIYGKNGMGTGKSSGYTPLLVEIVKCFKTGKPPVSSEETIEIYAFMSAADESEAQGGKPIALDGLLAKALDEVKQRTPGSDDKKWQRRRATLAGVHQMPRDRTRIRHQSGKLTRREFARATGAVVAPTVVPASVFGAPAPSNRINVALIGCGNQSRVDLPSMLRQADAQVVAVCDVNRGSDGYARPEHFLGREPAQKRVHDYYGGKSRSGRFKGCDAYSDFRDVLAREDVDAVMIVLPDHWHALATVKACEAGKDVYCQKPMSLTIHDGQQMVKAVRQHGRVLQTGSQYRSNAVVRRMCELVRNGRIGKVKRAISIINGSGAGPAPGWKEMPVPDGFDYEMWLGPAPDAPYHIDRCLYRFRFLQDYSGGQVTNTGAHATDIVQWALGMDHTGPVEFEHQPGIVWPPKGHLYTTAMKSHFRARYANGIEFVCRTQDPGFGARFEGTEGWVQYTVNNMKDVEASSDAIKKSVIGPDEIHLPVSGNHYRNFLDSVKSRKDPIEPVEVGHRTATICHAGNIAMRLQRELQWDPEKELFVNDDQANQMLRRVYRKPWQI